MGPERDERPTFKEEKLASVKVAAKKTIVKYFEHPLHYLFYGTLGLIVIGLFFGLHFQWQLYLILIILAGIKIFNFYKNDSK